MVSEQQWGNEFQNALYIGTNIQDILYGIELLLYFKTISVLLSKRRTRRKSDIFYALFSSTMLFLITIWVATQAAFGQQMWLVDAGFPGGANAYLMKYISGWCMDLGTTAIIILQLMADALMIYRCRIVWNSYRVVIIPIILWVTALVLSALADWTSSIPGGNIFTGVASQFGLAYWSVSVFLNTMLTSMIYYRIMWHGKRIQQRIGHEEASFYFSVATMIVESVLPYTLSGITFLVSYGVKSPTSIAFTSVGALAMCISPQMLILRVVIGTAWDSDTSAGPQTLHSTIQFDVEHGVGTVMREISTEQAV